VEKWPARSPDMNPIEEVWDLLERRIEKHSISTLAELKRRIAEEWIALSKNRKIF